MITFNNEPRPSEARTTALIRYEDVAVFCAVCDQRENGATLLITGTDIPDDFVLIAPPKEPKHCEVIRRDETSLDVRFIR